MTSALEIGIVGAGMAGLACAEALSVKTHRLTLLDKGRGAGGRMATRRLTTAAGEASFDMGAQYFTVRDPAFRRRVEAWTAAGLVAPWPAAGPDAHVGLPGMNVPVRQMAEAQTVRWASRVVRLEKVSRRWRVHTEAGELIDVDTVIIAIPAEQAAQLLSPMAADLATRAQAIKSAPCWTVMLAFLEPVPVTQNCFRGTGALGWAARNNSKPGRAGPESWILQASPDWSEEHLDADSGWIAARLIAEAASLLGTPLPASCAQACHRWRFARSGAEGSGAWWDPERRLGVCGDWLIGPRVEAAWQSGNLLAQRIDNADCDLLVS